MKNMSLGKLMAYFGGFVALMVIGTVVAMKMSAKGSNAPAVVTKRYTPEPVAQAPAPQPPPQPAPQPATPAPQQAALTPPAANAQAGQGAASPVGPATPAPVPNPMTSSASPMSAANGAPQGDVSQQLMVIDAKLTQLNTRVSALEAGKSAHVAPTAAHATNPKHHVAMAHAARRKKSTVVREEVVNEEKMLKDARDYKSMAVVGNRAWVSMSDGSEFSVATGEPVPAPRPRVRSIDPNTGVVIMSSDERINAR